MKFTVSSHGKIVRGSATGRKIVAGIFSPAIAFLIACEPG
jgi:hypothetical protein